MTCVICRKPIRANDPDLKMRREVWLHATEECATGREKCKCTLDLKKSPAHKVCAESAGCVTPD